MFIKNPSSINKDNIICIDEYYKDILISNGYSPLSYDKNVDKWIFVIVDTNMLELINTRKEDDITDG